MDDDDEGDAATTTTPKLALPAAKLLANPLAVFRIR
jgi:hypothetical protein